MKIDYMSLQAALTGAMLLFFVFSYLAPRRSEPRRRRRPALAREDEAAALVVRQTRTSGQP